MSDRAEAVVDRERRKHTRLSVVRRGALTVESVVYSFIGPYTKRCVVCDLPSELAVCCIERVGPDTDGR